jgi:tetratricopeptide (TPR) repeat protein
MAKVSNPSDKDMELFYEALSLLTKHEFKKAITLFTKFIKSYPKFDDAYVFRSHCYSDLDQHKKMLSDLNKAIKINPNNSHAYLMRGEYYRSINETDKAINNHTEATRIFEYGEFKTSLTDSRGYDSEEIVAYESHNYEREFATAFFLRGTSILESFLKKPYNKKTAQSLKECAAKDFMMAATIIPKFALAYLGLSNLARLSGDIDEAITAAKSALKYADNGKDKSTIANSLAALYLLNLDKYGPKKIIKLLNKAIKEDPDYYALYLHRGICYAALERYDEARDDYKKCLELNPDCEEAKLNLKLKF